MSDYTEHLISMAGGDGDALDLDAIQSRVDAATEGPWFVEVSGQGRERLHIIDAIVRDPYGDNSLSLGNDAATAEFIAHARTDVPALLALVREMAIQLEGVRSDMQAAMADAWDEGRESIAHDLMKPSGRNGMKEGSSNPYRAALTATEAP